MFKKYSYLLDYYREKFQLDEDQYQDLSLYMWEKCLRIEEDGGITTEVGCYITNAMSRWCKRHVAPKRHPVSVDTTTLSDAERAGYYIPPCDDDDSPQGLMHKMAHATIADVLGTLTPREQRCIDLRFGFTDGECYTLEDVSAMFRVSVERVRQIESRALRKLRCQKRRCRLVGLMELA